MVDVKGKSMGVDLKEKINALMEFIKTTFPFITSLNYIINIKKSICF